MLGNVWFAPSFVQFVPNFESFRALKLSKLESFRAQNTNIWFFFVFTYFPYFYFYFHWHILTNNKCIFTASTGYFFSERASTTTYSPTSPPIFTTFPFVFTRRSTSWIAVWNIFPLLYCPFKIFFSKFPLPENFSFWKYIILNTGRNPNRNYVWQLSPKICDCYQNNWTYVLLLWSISYALEKKFFVNLVSDYVEILCDVNWDNPTSNPTQFKLLSVGITQSNLMNNPKCWLWLVLALFFSFPIRFNMCTVSCPCFWVRSGYALVNCRSPAKPKPSRLLHRYGFWTTPQPTPLKIWQNSISPHRRKIWIFRKTHKVSRGRRPQGGAGAGPKAH